MFNFTVSRSSSNIRQINGNLRTKCVVVTYKNGQTYAFKGVSRSAMLNLIANYNLSQGKWVNQNCKNATSTRYLRVTDIIDMPFVGA